MRRLLLIVVLGGGAALTALLCAAWGLQPASGVAGLVQTSSQPMETFPTSLHGTRQGKITWYSEENGGFETLTGVPMQQLPCLKCHPGTYADGTEVDPATYEPGCADCHAQPGAPVSDETCLKCHSRQKLEMKFYSDVHRDAGFGCKDCHTSREMHGDGHGYDSMLEPGAMDIKCENCHTTLVDNIPHSIHQENVHCTACHTQSVITCYNCHFESMITEHVKRFPGPLRDFTLLVNRDGKVHTANMQTLVYQGKSFVAIGPYRSHTITAEGKHCSACHNNAVIQQYVADGKITVTRWDAEQGQIVITPEVIPVPPDWQEVLQFDFLNYIDGQWVFLKSGADGMQMLYSEPLTEEQMQKLQIPPP